MPMAEPGSEAPGPRGLLRRGLRHGGFSGQTAGLKGGDEGDAEHVGAAFAHRRPATRYWGHCTKMILSSGMWEHGENAGAPALTKVRFAGFTPAKPGFNLRRLLRAVAHKMLILARLWPL